MKVFFFSPFASPDSNRYSTFEKYISQTLHAEIVRQPALTSQCDPKYWLDNLLEQVLSADILIMISPSQTLISLGTYGSEVVDKLIDRFNGGVPAIISFSWHDIPNCQIHEPSVRGNLERLFKNIEAKPLDIRVSNKDRRAVGHDYTVCIAQEDLLQPDYVGETGSVFVNQANLMLYDGKSYPLVLAKTNVELINSRDLPALSVPGLKPTIALYRKVKTNYQIICTGGLFYNTYTGPTGTTFPGAEDNKEFIQRILTEVGRAAPTFENRAHEAYRYFVKCERGVGILLDRVFDGKVAKNLTTEVRNKLKDHLNGDLGRLNLLEMLEAIRSRDRWSHFEAGMRDSKGNGALSRKDFGKLVDDVNQGARNILAHPAKSVFSNIDIEESDIQKLKLLEQTIWAAREHFGCMNNHLNN